MSDAPAARARPVLLRGRGVDGLLPAGFDVVGVDMVPRPAYPFPFVQSDALDAARELCQEFDLVHYSPPCQASCALTKGTNRGRRKHLDLIPQVRELCEWYGVPYVIENVQGANLRKDLLLCGEMFGLSVLRHRYFELGPYWRPRPAPHKPHRGPVRGWRHGIWRDGPYIAAYGKGGGKGSVPEMQQAMGITWTETHEELTEAIPPAYTQHIGQDFIADDWCAATVPSPEVRLLQLARSVPHPSELGVAA